MFRINAMLKLITAPAAGSSCLPLLLSPRPKLPDDYFAAIANALKTVLRGYL